VGGSNSTIGTAYNIDSLFGTVEPLFVGTTFEVDGRPFIQDSMGNNISSNPHVQIISDESGRAEPRTKDYFSFNATAGSFLTLDVDCAYSNDFLNNPCYLVTLTDQVDTIIKLIAPNGDEFVNDQGGVDFDFSLTSDDFGTSDVNDSFLEMGLLMSGLWVIEIGGFIGPDEINPFFTDEGYLLNVTLSAVPVPAALWLFGSALIGLIGISRRKIQA
jgi:hypothetical protein